MNYDDFVDQIKRHEGYVDKVYLDTVGIPTGGWGHAFLPGSTIPIAVAEKLLWHDLKDVTEAYRSLGLPLDPDDEVREYTIKNMLFNLGLTRFLGFRKMLAAIRRRDYEGAAAEMLNSKWARQVGHRAIELAEQMRTGIFKGV